MLVRVIDNSLVWVKFLGYNTLTNDNILFGSVIVRIGGIVLWLVQQIHKVTVNFARNSVNCFIKQDQNNSEN
jgi:hypothetical protein